MKRKLTQDQVLKKYAQIPANIGFDPYNAWIWRCNEGCGNEGYKFENQLDMGVRRRVKENYRGFVFGGCNRCRAGKMKCIAKMPEGRAFHLNAIRLRPSNMRESDAVL